MAETVWRQGFGAGLPTEADDATELAVPHPAVITGQPRHGRSVRKYDRTRGGFAIDQLRHESIRVGRDGGELLTRRCLAAFVVGRPAAFERRDIACQVLSRRPDERHAGDTL